MSSKKEETQLWSFRVMMEVESGNHANVPGVDLFPVSAVKIQVCHWSSSAAPQVMIGWEVQVQVCRVP
jgi:hypothetical protein